VVSSGSFWPATEKVVPEAVILKPKLQWRPQEVGDARNMKHLLKKKEGRKQHQPKTMAMWVAAHQAIRTGVPKQFGAHIPKLLGRHRATEFNVYPSRFCFGPFPPFYVPIFPI
jgi:hypothetical protein